MLYNIQVREKFTNKYYVGDGLNIIYRFKGVFFIVTGTCFFNREKSIGILAKKKEFYVFFFMLKKGISFIKKLDTFYYNSIRIKVIYKSKC